MRQKFNTFRLYIFYAVLLLVMSGRTAGAVQADNKPTGLSVNFLSHPDMVFLDGYLVNTSLSEAVSGRENYQFAEIAQKKPFFGWIVNSDQNNTLQTAYQIIIASSLENIEKNNGDYWDSRKIESDQSVNVVYAGKALKPNSVYFWKVKTWDNHGIESGYSVISQFKTAAELVDYATARYPLQKQDQFPVTIHSFSKSETFIDFGKDAFGRLRLTLEGRNGNDTITVRLGESMKNGLIDRNPGGTIRYSSYKLILKGGWNTYVITINPDKRNTGPRAVHLPDYIGEVTPFRYCEIEGYSGSLEKQQIIRETVFYPFDETESYFSSSDTVLNQVWDLCKYSMKATSFAGTFVDGDRERIAYEADALINQLGFYNVVRDYSIARSTHEYLINHPT
ncbi:MAG: family 78 glycoside hydrolase catalytic domain, partial [Bacteroidota bacterium]|nr:family 78 glycoside hydrolase catalytic domain [Bacteroidota bacterium]